MQGKAQDDLRQGELMAKRELKKFLRPLKEYQQ